MKGILKSYGFTLVLLFSIILGGIIGFVFDKEDVMKLQPLGDLFLNVLFMIIVPMVFFSVSSALANMSGLKRFGKIMGAIFAVFLVTSIVAAIIAFIATRFFLPVEPANIDALKGLMQTAETTTENVPFLQRIVQMFTVTDFSELLTRQHILQLIVFSVLFGTATAFIGEKGKPVADFLKSVTEVLMKLISIIMWYAPIGLGCYFATIIASLGSQIAEGYARSFVLYLVIAAIMYFGLFTFYAYLSGGKAAVSTYWKHVVSPSVAAISTCSSAACIPLNIEATKKMGVPYDIADTVIPLGTNIHKDGSVVGGVLKIVFLFALFGKDMDSISSWLAIVAVAFFVGVVMGAIPGGGAIGETLILSIFFPNQMDALPLIMTISIIIDMPATLLNATGNTISTLLVTRIVEGKNWVTAKIQ